MMRIMFSCKNDETNHSEAEVEQERLAHIEDQDAILLSLNDNNMFYVHLYDLKSLQAISF